MNLHGGLEGYGVLERPASWAGLTLGERAPLGQGVRRATVVFLVQVGDEDLQGRHHAPVFGGADGSGGEGDADGDVLVSALAHGGAEVGEQGEVTHGESPQVLVAC